jgi:hypothetical protein
VVFPILKALYPHFENCNMELIEREGFLALLQTESQQVTEGEVHCIFPIGEAVWAKPHGYMLFAILHF